MTEQSASLEAQKKRRPGITQIVTQNPVILKELRGRMRSGRTFVLLTTYLAILSALVSLVYFGFVASSSAVGGTDARQTMGKTVFWVVAGLELMMVCFIGPALTAGAISSEREHQTFDLLRTTLLSPKALVFGKLLSALSYIFLLLLAGFPLLSLSFLFGGVAIEEVFVAFFILIVTAIFYCSLGLLLSSIMKRTLGSTVLTYVGTVIIVFGIPAVIFTLIAIFSSITNSINTSSTLFEIIFYTVGWLFVSGNPLATGIATQVMLIEKQSLFFTTLPLTNGGNFPILSPWISYGVLYLLLSVVIIWVSVLFVKRTEK